MNLDEHWMRIALHEANLALKEDEVPVGAVLVQNERLIAQGHNQSIKSNDPTAHAEIQVLRLACRHEKNYRLPESTLYVTLEPCAMCFGAMVHARIQRVVFGALDPKTGVCGSCEDFSKFDFFNHRLTIKAKILEEDCSEILKSFFKFKR